MKNFKKSVSALVIALITTVTMGVYAYTGDTDDNNIQIIKQYENGKGIVQLAPSASAGYKLYYQWVDSDKNTYNDIVKINKELEVIKYYNLYTGALAAGVQDSPYGEEYEQAQKQYKATYGTEVTDFSDAHAMGLEATKTHAFPNFENSDAKWVRSTDNTLTMDISTFSGTKYLVGWVKLVQNDGTTTYNAQVFKFEGTKSEDNNNNNNNNNNGDNNNDNNNNNNNGDNNNGNNNNNNNNNGGNNNGNNNNDNNNNNNSDNKDNNNNSNNSNIKDDGKEDPNDGKDQIKPSTQNDPTKSSSNLPKTGLSYGTVVAMIAAAGVAVVEFIKYRRIK